MKPYRFYLLFTALIVSASLLSCGSNQTPKAPEKVCLEDVDMEAVLDRLVKQAEDPPSLKIYILFTSTRCESCEGLEKDLAATKLDSEIYLLNVEFTWAFLLSRHLQVSGVPTLVVFTQGVPRFGRQGADAISAYLRANAIGDK